MNYGEGLAYWYLRLNGFFPLRNFVVHRHSGHRRRSDVDVLAVRPPQVYEEIGGQQGDWDPFLAATVPLNRFLCVICDVKTGVFTGDDLFARPNLLAATQRLGLLAPAACAVGTYRIAGMRSDRNGSTTAAGEERSMVRVLFSNPLPLVGQRGVGRLQPGPMGARGLGRLAYDEGCGCRHRPVPMT